MPDLVTQDFDTSDLLLHAGSVELAHVAGGVSLSHLPDMEAPRETNLVSGGCSCKRFCSTCLFTAHYIEIKLFLNLSNFLVHFKYVWSKAAQ